MSDDQNRMQQLISQMALVTDIEDLSNKCIEAADDVANSNKLIKAKTFQLRNAIEAEGDKLNKP